MNNVIFGRYTNYHTPIHRLEPRLKLFLLVLLISIIFFKFTVWSTNLIYSLFLLIFFFVLMGVSKSSFLSLLKSFKAMWFLILFLFIVYIFFPNSSYQFVAFYIGTYPIYWDAIYQTVYIILRLFLMISIMMVLTSTTKPMDLTYAFEWYMTPLKLIKFPVHAGAMALSIALRFVPTLLEETDRIMKAQASRGIDFNHGSLGKRFKAVISLIIPFFLTAFQRSDDLAEAMEVRGYDPNAKRTRYRKYSLHLVDLFSSLIILLIFAGVLTLFIIDKTVGPLDLIQLIFKVDIGF